MFRKEEPEHGALGDDGGYRAAFDEKVVEYRVFGPKCSFSLGGSAQLIGCG